MRDKKAARHSCNYARAKTSTSRRDGLMIPRDEYERGCKWAAFLLCAMFAFLSLGVVVWGW